jgi:hypothetical protein
VISGREVINFWDIDTPRVFLVHSPAWLRIDEHTGLLSGTPVVAGNTTLIVQAALATEVRKLDERQLSWRVGKVLSQTTQHAGSTTPELIIEVYIQGVRQALFSTGRLARAAKKLVE